MKDNDYKLNKSKTIRLSDSASKTIKYMVKEKKLNESELLRNIIENAIDEYRLKKAFKAIENGELSISGASKLAGLSYRDFYNKMIENNIKMDFDRENILDNSYKLLDLVDKNSKKK